MSNFAFLQTEWPALHDVATKAESLAHPDPASRGPEGVFEATEIDKLPLALSQVRERAVV